MQEVVYNGDKRYPGPEAYPPPAGIEGIPTQAELDAYPRMFTWGELKGIIRDGDLELLMRNKALQARYDVWMTGMKVKYGSTEKYLTQVRLPWTKPKAPAGTYDLASSPPLHTDSSVPKSIAELTLSTRPGGQAVKIGDISHAATPGRGGGDVSGAATPTSAGFVSLASLRLVDGKLRKACTTTSARSGTSTPGLGSGNVSEAGTQAGEGEGEVDEPVYLKWDDAGLDKDKYAVLPNDWPYNIPHGVRHYCVWSRVPIAHPELVDYDPDAWSRIEREGLGGFSGITPLRSFKINTPPPADDPNANPSQTVITHDMAGRQKFIGELPDRDWYAADVAYAGREMREWAGVKYQSKGGEEVGRMVRGLWDPRGWECLWFVNPPRLQSVPGFSHFHVFARRKTPEEIDASEAFKDEE